MPCFHPLRGWRCKREGPEGQRGITFSIGSASVNEPVMVPCGNCIGCRLLMARGWAIRCQHEASLHELNCFITLTYDDKHLPEGGTLVKRDFQLFMKRLRKFVEPVRISFFACGEYGEVTQRPHYHALLFGMDFLDKVPVHFNQNEHFRSESLAALWPQGANIVAPVTPKSCAYVAGYVTKKAGLRESIDEDGVISEKEPEFRLMSRRPAIGKRWIEKFVDDVYPDDFVVREGREVPAPGYYDKRLRVVNPHLYAVIKAERVGAMWSDEAWKDSKPSRLAVRKIVAQAKVDLRKGSL